MEALSYPFIGENVFDQLGLEADDPNRRVVKLVNPLSDEEPALRTTLLPGLLAALRRNDGRGSHDLALFETGLVFHPQDELKVAVRLPVDRRPTDEEIASLTEALPVQPRHAAVVLGGAREQAGWWGKGRPADWADAVEAARTLAREAGAELIVDQGQYGPWHPGRCAELKVVVDSTSSPSATPVSCTRASSRRSACPPAPAPWRSTWTAWRGPARARCARRASPPSRWPRRTSR